jgi:hypothetical protein
MDKLSVEIILQIAQNVDLSDIHHWAITSRRYHYYLGNELYIRALSHVQKYNAVYYLTCAALLNCPSSESFKALLAGTDVADINQKRINFLELLDTGVISVNIMEG